MKLQTIKVPDKPLGIAALGDIQFTGGKLRTQMGCSVSHLKEHLEWATKGLKVGKAHIFPLKGHHLQWIGTGDYIDLLSPSNRDRYRMSGLYSSATRVVDWRFAEIVEELAEILAPYLKGKMVTLCRGHHWFQWSSEKLPYMDSERYLGALLGMEDKPNQGVTESQTVITFKWPNGAKYNVLAMHGEGNGQSLAYGINKLARLIGGWDAIDAVFSGHFHKLTSAKTPRLRVSENGTRVLDRDIRMLTSGSFLRGYVLDDEMYPEVKQLAPLSLGSSVLSVYPKKKVDGAWEFETLTLER